MAVDIITHRLMMPQVWGPGPNMDEGYFTEIDDRVYCGSPDEFAEGTFKLWDAWHRRNTDKHTDHWAAEALTAMSEVLREGLSK